ncbi:MAG: endonuclease/exonuclease/phosphatase family protein, partial [Bacteroidota bacterium]
MTPWQTIWAALGLLFSLVSFFPLVNSNHWLFRFFDFVRLQLSLILIALLITGLLLSVNATSLYYFTIGFLTIAIGYQAITVSPFLPRNQKKAKAHADKITVISVNVLQENTAYDRLISLVKDKKPDILLTMETNIDWEKGLAVLEGEFKHAIKVPKDNRYGMHLYTNLDINEYQVRYLISEEHPSIEATLQDKNQRIFTFWGIHPPPPSPTEKPTSSQKDAELMKVAKLALESKIPVIISGDFNTVCWSKVSKLFSKISKLKDARLKKGFYGTFPARF